MKILASTILLLLLASAYAKPILIVTTDIGQDPDDQQSMVRLLHYADQFQLAGIIANADANYEHEAPIAKTEILHELIDAYGKIEHNLRIHSPSFPSAAYLHSIVKEGCAGNGRTIPVGKYVGEGKDTEGSNWIINVVDNAAEEPVIISVWGGACDLAQALWKVKSTRSAKEVKQFVSKLRVYFIGKQDSSNDWVIDNFPELWLILALAESGNSWESTYRGMFLGGDISTTSKEWLNNHIIGVNPLASLYPDKAWTGKRNPHGAMKEGDSPALLFFIENGLNSSKNPHWGGWGGRFLAQQNASIFRDTPDSLLDSSQEKYISDTQASVYRWRSDFQKDFAARVNWGAAITYKDANHYPVIQLTEPLFSNEHIEISTDQKTDVSLDASLSFDPDGDQLIFDWMLYPEASGLPTNHGIKMTGETTSKVSLVLSDVDAGKEVHLILRVSDMNPTPLVAYKRFVVRVN